MAGTEVDHQARFFGDWPRECKPKPEWYVRLKSRGPVPLVAKEMTLGECLNGQHHQFKRYKQTVRPDLEPVKLAGGHERHYSGPDTIVLTVQACERCRMKLYTDMKEGK